MTFYGIYKITNLLNGKMYIGQHRTDNLDDGYMGSGKWLERAIKKYGVENFRKEWIMFCEDADELNYWERVFVDETWVMRSDTYNLCLGGEGGGTFMGRHHSESTKQTMSASHKGNKNCLGKKLSIETKMKISKSLLGKKVSDETRQRLSSSLRKARGRPEVKESYRLTAKQRGQKISAALRGRVGFWSGKTMSDETKEKMSKTRTGKKFPKETKRKISEAMKSYWAKRRAVDNLTTK